MDTVVKPRYDYLSAFLYLRNNASRE
ncbi:MAG TPA: hypothetical protein LFW20_06945 [Rickettsia endosymbiont of Omalisus fontisbellaquei]|nr:hypothetical protein [Rickettsia endosymbiont of Omalisus fontisbellaquei]